MVKRKTKRKLSRCPECGSTHFIIEIEKGASPAIKIECSKCGDGYRVDLTEEEMVFVTRGMGHKSVGVV